tara:strand:- start:94 stop:618 length:525 start_codon:yes stop_codon:yes gene_type:complete
MKRWHTGHIEPFWTKQSITKLNYERPANLSADQDTLKWRRLGYIDTKEHLTGLLCDMKKPQPAWNPQLIDWFEKEYGVQDTGTSYFKMITDSILPVHADSFTEYRKLFNCKRTDCIRVIIFPMDWESGHYFEIEGEPIVNWKAGDYVMWQDNVPHMAANIGATPRYTIQLTGHK